MASGGFITNTPCHRRKSDSKVFEDTGNYESPCSPVKCRSHSKSSHGGKRSRMVSGVSDIIEELFGPDGDLQTAAANLIHTLDEMPSESSEIFSSLMEHEGHGILSPLLTNSRFCTKCGCDCTRIGTIWRCSSKFCLEWDTVEQSQTLQRINGGFHPMNLDSQMTDSFLLERNFEGLPIKQEILKNHENVSKNIVLTRPVKPEIFNDNQLMKGNTLSTRSIKQVSNDNEDTVKNIKPEPILDQKLDKQKRLDESESNAGEFVYPEKKEFSHMSSPRQFSLSPPTSPTCRSPIKVPSPHQFSLSPLTSPTCRSPVKLKEKKTSKRILKYGAFGMVQKQSKVQMTPPIDSTGLRHCSFCNGQVRPQMCGKKSYRWRCVSKNCRKWYGGVMKDDEIPKDIGRFGRSSALGEPKPKKSKHVKKLSLIEKPENISLFDQCNNLLNSEENVEWNALKEVGIMLGKKIKKRVAQKKEKRLLKLTEDEEPLFQDLTPLTHGEMEYYPSNMEKRARWWINEKRTRCTSPEREFESGMLNATAAFRVLTNACRTAAITRADEVGTVNGSLDLLMDSLMACMGPLFSALCKLPKLRSDASATQQAWNASAVHTPIFS